MTEIQARRVAVEFTVTGANHAQISARAEKVWQGYLDDPKAQLPFDTEITATPRTTGDGVIIIDWEASVLIRRRGGDGR